MKKRSNFTPMERFHEILIGHGLDATNVWINHIRIILDGKKLFDYYPLKMKLFDYHNWHQLTYPSFLEGVDKWEPELDGIIKKLMVSPSKFFRDSMQSNTQRSVWSTFPYLRFFFGQV